MRVVIVRNAFSYDFGGAEKLAVFLGRELQDNGHKAVVVTAHRKVTDLANKLGVSSLRGWWWSKQNWSGKRILITPAYFVWLVMLFAWYCLLLARLKPDVLHLMSKDDFIAGTAAGKLLKIKVIWTDCADLKFLYSHVRLPFRNLVGKLVLAMSRHADTVTIVSHNEMRLIEETLGRQSPDNYRVVYMVGRDELVTPTKRSLEDNVVFCSTSRLVIAKGISELIDAFALVAKNHPDYKLWIVGDGPDAKIFKKQASSNSAITFFGHQDDPLQYLATADIYVHPTYHEGFSLSLAEAAMLAKPMIATEVGGNPELVNEKNGILIPIKDVEKLAAAMETLSNNSELRKKLGSQARQDFIDNFDFAKVVRKDILPIYEQA